MVHALMAEIQVLLAALTFTNIIDNVRHFSLTCQSNSLVSHVARNWCERVNFPTVSFLCRTKKRQQTWVHSQQNWKMILGSVDLSFVDVLWTFLALCFLVAFCVHKISPHLPRKYEICRLYVLFQDLIRYGKTKQNLKRDDWLRVFDVPKRYLNNIMYL